MNVRAMIVDDEQHAIDSFIKIASKACPYLLVTDAFTRPDIFIKHLENAQTPDVIFLDVEMSPYSGFKSLELIQEKNKGPVEFDVIFLTAYDQYAIKAFKYNALDYLLKPLLAEDLKLALQKWQEKKYKYLHPVQWQQLSHYVQNSGNIQDRMAIPTFEGYEIIHFDKIVRCEADRNYTRIINNTGQVHIVCRSLKEVENVVKNHQFLRIHHSHIINPDFVLKILKTDGGVVEMTDGCQIRITRNKEQNLEKLFTSIRKL